MAWTPLTDRLDTLPLMLAGPILRHTTESSVTVWVALSSPRTVTLSILEGDRLETLNELMSGTRETIHLGAHLFIVTVTAKLQPSQSPLRSGQLYYYNLAFAVDGSAESPHDLLSPSNVISQGENAGDILSYDPSIRLPSFVLPPEKIGDLRIIQGSCRKSNSSGLEALEAVDVMLNEDWEAPNRRPHQLFFTGDQIYADELSSAMLALSTDIGTTLLCGASDLWEEELPQRTESEEEPPPSKKSDFEKLVYPYERSTLPKPADVSTDLKHIHPSEVPPSSRREVVQQIAKFTTTCGTNHLIGLGEFFAMYLLIWSEVLWPPKDGIADPKNEAFIDNPRGLPGYLELFPNIDQYPSPIRHDQESKRKKFLKSHRETYLNETHQLIEFRESLPKIRRLLANIPVYMVFDDHEVTDDWNLTRASTIETTQSLLGPRIELNALLSYAIFQAWGNTPELYEAGQAGADLLDNAQSWVLSRLQETTPETTQEARIERGLANLLGLPFTDDEKTVFINALKQGRFRRTFEAEGTTPPPVLTWHFHHQWHRHEVIAIDSRTWREFSRGDEARPDQFSQEGLAAQIPDTPSVPNGVTLILAPTNIVTVPLFHAGERWYGEFLLRTFKKGKPKHKMLPYDPDLFDSWEAQTPRFEALLGRLAARGAASGGGRKRSHIVVLSGDVHFGWSSRLQYEASRPFSESGQTLAASEFVMAHLTSSGLNNQVPMWKIFHHGGYIVSRDAPEYQIWFGWNNPQTPGLTAELINREAAWDKDIKFRPWMLERKPAMLRLREIESGERVPAPDWSYRIDYILGLRDTNLSYETILSQDPASPGTFAKALRNHRKFAEFGTAGTQMIADNNLGEVIFHWDASTTLRSAVDATAQEIPVEDLSGFPKPPFLVRLGDELIQVNQLGPDSFINVQRGLMDTLPTPHATDSPVVIYKQAVHIAWWRSQETDPTIKPQTQFAIPMEFDDRTHPMPL